MTVIRHPNNQGVTLQQWRKTAAGGETSLSGTDDFSAGLAYTVGAEEVFVNGVLIERGVDYTATSGTSVTLTNALVAGDLATVSSPSAFNVANAIPKATVTAKGDVIVGTAASTVTNLAVGADGTTLVANSASATGVAWAGPIVTAGKNYLINGGMDIWQRGTSGFTSAQYSADRWFITSSGGTLAGSRSTDVPTNPYFNYSYSMVGTSANNVQVYQRIESANSTSLAGRTVTLSVWAKNSAGTTALSYVALFPTAVDNWASSTVDSTANLTATSWSSSWTRYSVTFTVSASAVNGYGIIFFRNGTETSTTLLTGIQLEIGSVATAFTRAGGTLQGELAAAQRYYQVIGGTSNAYPIIQSYSPSNGTDLRQSISFPVKMRTAPTATKNGTWTVGSCGQPTADYLTADGFALKVTSTAAATVYAYPDSTDDTITFSAEL